MSDLSQRAKVLGELVDAVTSGTFEGMKGKITPETLRRVRIKVSNVLVWMLPRFTEPVMDAEINHVIEQGELD